MSKNQFIPFDPVHLNIFQSTFNFHEFVSTCKKSGYFRYIVDINILQSDWQIVFCPITLAPVSQIWDLCRNIAYNINFDYTPYSGKINDQIFQ